VVPNQRIFGLLSSRLLPTKVAILLKISYSEKDEIINDQNMVAECFNDFFINVAKDIGNVTVVDKNHPSIIEINKNKKRYT
jgi:hypothetical protein